MDNSAAKIAYEGPEFELFCDHFNTRLRVIDFDYAIRRMEQPGYSALAPATLFLPIEQELGVKPLFESDYPDFILAVCQRLAITPHAEDSFRSELADEILADFKAAIVKMRDQVSVTRQAKPPGFLVALPDLLSDLIIAPISQLHAQVVGDCNHFAEFIQAVGGDPSRLFLNPHASSVFSMYIVTWVATRMNVPLQMGNGEGGMVAVI